MQTDALRTTKSIMNSICPKFFGSQQYEWYSCEIQTDICINLSKNLK